MAFPTSAVLDNFNRASIGTGWSVDPFNAGSSGIAITSNQASGGSGFRESYYNAATYGPDCEVYCTIATLPTSGSTVGLGARIQSPDSASADGYYIEFLNSGTDAVAVYRVVNGTFSAALANINQNFSAGDGLGAEITGTGATVTI